MNITERTGKTTSLFERARPSQPACAASLPNHAESQRLCQPIGETTEASCEASPQPDWLLWQLADSAFPTGGFAHSNGLEAAWRHGAVRDGMGLDSFVEASLRQFGHGSIPFVTAAHRDESRLIELDFLCESFTPNHVANRASRSQGRSLLASAQRIFGPIALKGLDRARAEELPCCHLAPVFGVIARSLDIGLSTACRLFLFLHLRGLIASAVRLGIVGSLEAQSLQHSLGARAGEILDRCQNLPIE